MLAGIHERFHPTPLFLTDLRSGSFLPGEKASLKALFSAAYRRALIPTLNLLLLFFFFFHPAVGCPVGLAEVSWEHFSSDWLFKVHIERLRPLDPPSDSDDFPVRGNELSLENGAFLSHRATPSHHAFE